MKPQLLRLPFRFLHVGILATAAAAFAQSAPGPVIPVYDAQDLDDVRNILHGDYLQMADIDLTGYALDPIGTDTNPFTGSYNGNGFKIKNLTFNGAGLSHVGLFGKAVGALFENITLVNTKITGANHVGGLVGLISDGTVTDCHATVAPGSTPIPYNVTAETEGGGLIGRAHETLVQSCSSTAAVSVSGIWCGVLIGHVHIGSTVLGCTAAGRAVGSKGVGGLSGNVHGSLMEDCSANSQVIGETVCGGLVGWIQEDRSPFDYDTIVRDCHSTSTITSTTADSVFFTDPWGNFFFATASDGGIGGWTDDNSLVEDCTAVCTITSPTGDAINTGGLLGLVAHDCVVRNCHSDTNILSGNTCGGLVGWAQDDTVIEYCSAAGTIECEWQSGGLVGAAERCTVQYCEADTDLNCTGADNDHAETGHELAAVGGLVGYTFPSNTQQFHTRIHCSAAHGNISGHGQMMGGLVGLLWGCKVTESYATGNVLGDDRKLGGLVGEVFGPNVGNDFPDANEVSEVHDCYAWGQVEQAPSSSGGEGLVGGLFGSLEASGSKVNKVFRSYSIGQVIAPQTAPDVGGMIGDTDTLAIVDSCYWDTQTSGWTTSDGGTGTTTAEMMMQSTFVGWDFDTVWFIDSSYPLLRCPGP